MAVEFSAFASLPLGKVYSGIDYSNKKSGYASTGYIVEGSFTWLGAKKLGLVLQALYQSNPLKDTASSVIPSGTSFPLGTKPWKNIYVMGGPAYMNHFGKILVDVHVTGGFVVSSGPLFNLTNPETQSNESKTATGFSIGFGLGAGYMLSRHFAIKINAGYLAGFPSIKKQYNAYPYWDPAKNQVVYTTPAEINISKTISVFNIGAGVVYQF